LKKILLLSDTHGKIDDFINAQLKVCDEVWHAGDLGGGNEIDQHFLSAGKPFRAVWGNIDSQERRLVYPEIASFTVEGVQVLMTHRGGFPGKYAAGVKELITRYRPTLFICGHSHILRIMHDKEFGLLFINPGAAGVEGFHKVRTMVRFTVSQGKVGDVELVETDRSIRGNSGLPGKQKNL